MESKMKKSLLALVLPSLFASTVGAVEVYNDDNQSVNVYGRAYAGHDFSGEDKNANYGNDSYIRIGAKLKSDISESLSAFARYELQWDLADGEKQDKTKKLTLVFKEDKLQSAEGDYEIPESFKKSL